MNIKQNNQDPSYYSRDYYLYSAAGGELFKLGSDSPHLLYSYIFNQMKVDVKNKSVLDLGCGRGELCIASARKGARKVVGLDFSQDAIEISKEHLKNCHDLKKDNIFFLQGNALELALNEKFDVIFLTDIVEHLYDEQLQVIFKCVGEHLAKNGIVVIHTMPTKEFIMFGQLFKFVTYLLKRKKHHFLTFKSQANITHVNLHHREQLARNLKNFDSKIWYDFAEQSKLKKIISKTPIVRFLSGNLWAIARHKSTKTALQ